VCWGLTAIYSTLTPQIKGKDIALWSGLYYYYRDIALATMPLILRQVGFLSYNVVFCLTIIESSRHAYIKDILVLASRLSTLKVPISWKVE